MSTGYSWAGIRQVRATLLGVGHVPERLCGFLLGALYQVLDLYYRYHYITIITSVIYHIGNNLPLNTLWPIKVQFMFLKIPT